MVGLCFHEYQDTKKLASHGVCQVLSSGEGSFSCYQLLEVFVFLSAIRHCQRFPGPVCFTATTTTELRGFTNCIVFGQFNQIYIFCQKHFCLLLLVQSGQESELGSSFRYRNRADRLLSALWLQSGYCWRNMTSWVQRWRTWDTMFIAFLLGTTKYITRTPQ